VRWFHNALKTGVLVTALLVAGGVGVMLINDAGAKAPSSAVNRNSIACQYVFQVYSGTFQHPLKSFRPSAFSHKVEVAASKTLRTELAYWNAAKAYKNWSGVIQVGTAMVNTCDHLGLSNA
jgi:hypothetical protein